MHLTNLLRPLSFARAKPSSLSCATLLDEFSVKIMISPVTSYSFDRAQCLANDFHCDNGCSILGGLSSSPNKPNCINSDGVASGSKIKSQLSVSTLKANFANSDFSLELWLAPKLNMTERSVIAAVGRDAVSDSYCRNNLIVSLGVGSLLFDLLSSDFYFFRIAVCPNYHHGHHATADRVPCRGL